MDKLEGKVEIDIDYGGTDIMVGEIDLIKLLLDKYSDKDVVITIEPK